ncbi:hypothetical protein VE02_01239 [Pseudogymnoascus sp. 03VT05]|nr:hypothetical protein VE02_01239 [Pseudogymnoascus sp. 03VT05]
MSPLRRRSSRIRGSKNTPYKRNESTLNNLAPIGEQEGTPSRGAAAASTFNVVEASPQVPNTPTTAGRIKPAREEMHPSKAQQSTTKKDDEGIRHGFTDIGARKPEILTTPSKLNINSTSEFEFRFAKPAPSLGPEAQQMMYEIREDARRIKAELAAKRDEEIAMNGGDVLGVLAGRKFAQPKGKAGRYSDVHMAEFKKMDSIAAHPSAFRAQPGRITPVVKTLKRTQSKANLADRDVSPAKQTTPLAKTLKRTQSKANLADRDAIPAKQTIKLVRPSVCPDNEVPAKRARQMGARDTSFARPSSRDANMQPPSKPSTPTTGRTANFLNSLSTPTQSSLARAATIKQDGTPQSALRRSPSKIALTPGLVKSATMNNLSSLSRSESKHKFTDKMKSILRRPTVQTDNTMPPPPSSIPSLMKSPSRANLRQEIPSAPATPTTKTLPRSKSTKHVNFTPTTATKNEPHHSPTPLKSNIPRSKSFANLNSVAYPTLPSASKPAPRPAEKQPESTITYPSLPQLPSSPTLSRTPLQPIPIAAAVTVPGVFTFNSGQTIKFGTPPVAPQQRNLGTSPGQTSIRQVRPSILPPPTTTAMPGAFPDADKENEAPAIPHGLANKKRARAASPGEVEVRAPEVGRKRVRTMEDVGEDGGAQEERSPKKRRGNEMGAETMAMKIVKEQMAPKSNIPSPAKRAGGLSLSRLKMLAMPKSRR